MTDKNRNLKYIRAKNRVAKEKSFYTHCLIYVLVNTAITAVKIGNDIGHWGSFTEALLRIDILSVWLVWGVFLVLHYLYIKFGQGWEERKIEALMNKELLDHSKRRP